jgi:hypothetical protein
VLEHLKVLARTSMELLAPVPEAQEPRQQELAVE